MARADRDGDTERTVTVTVTGSHMRHRSLKIAILASLVSVATAAPAYAGGLMSVLNTS